MTTVAFKTVNGACIGTVTIPLTAAGTPASLVLRAAGVDKADALAKATALASYVSDDPVVGALIPKHCRANLRHVRTLATAAKHSPAELHECLQHFRGHGKRKLAKALMVSAAGLGDFQSFNADTSLLGDIEVGGFWGRLKKIARKAKGYAKNKYIRRAWKYAKKHRATIAKTAARFAIGAAGVKAVTKAYSLVAKAKKNHPAAIAAIKQVAQAAASGDPTAKLMANVIKNEVKAETKQVDMVDRAIVMKARQESAPLPTSQPLPSDAAYDQAEDEEDYDDEDGYDDEDDEDGAAVDGLDIAPETDFVYPARGEWIGPQ